MVPLDDGLFTSISKGKTTTIYYSKLGETSLVIPEWTDLRILIDSKNDEIAEVELHRLDVIEYGRGYVLKGKDAMAQLNERRVSINFKRFDKGLFEIVPAGPLLPGHYGMAIYQKSYTFELR